MVDVELDYWSWLARITERLTFIRLNVIEHREISDSDYDLLRVLFKPWNNGEYPLFATKPIKSEETSVQIGLFAENVTSVTDGTEVVKVFSEPKTEKRCYQENLDSET